MPMDEMPIEELSEDVRLIVREFRSNPSDSAEDAACRAIHLTRRETRGFSNYSQTRTSNEAIHNSKYLDVALKRGAGRVWILGD